MDCAQAESLLPWLLNGTLSAAERAAVEAHLAGCASCAAARAEAELAYAAHAVHPREEELVDLAWDRVSGEAAELLAAHARACATCAEELALLRESRAAAEAGTSDASPAAVLPFPTSRPTAAPRWRLATLAAGLAALALLAAGTLALELRAARRETAAADAARAAAEARLAGLAGTEERLRREAAAARDAASAATRRAEALEGQVAALPQPELNPPVFELLPQELVVRGGAPAPEVLRYPTGTPRLTLILATSPGQPPARALELRDTAGALLWRAQGLREQPTGDYTVTFPTALLPPAGCELRLLGDRGEVVARFAVRPRPSGP
jgi:hypothetical protein